MSDKPVAERLQVKGARRLGVAGAPGKLDGAIGAAEARADVAQADVMLLFVADRAAWARDVPALLRRLRIDAILWIAYPKLSSRLAADLSRGWIFEAAAAQGLKTVSQIAIDADWSAMRMKRIAAPVPA